MTKNLDQRIHERAHEIWESEGRSGDPKDHLVRAEQELKDTTAPKGKDAPGAETSEDKIIDQLGDFA